nr:hypothetical protein [Tanacetum cinerariifolium]
MSFGVATLRALVHAGDKTNGDARSWYMISGDAKSWVCDCSTYIHCHIAQLSNCLRYWHNDWVLNQTYELTNIIVDVFEYHFQAKRMIVKPAVASREGGMGRRVGSKGRRVREPRRRNVEQTGELKGQGNDLSFKVNEGVDGVPDFFTIIAQQLQNLLPTILAQVGKQGGCSYKEILVCNPNEYDGKGRTIVYTHWIEKMELVQDMSRYGDDQKMREEFCPSNEMQKLETGLWNHAMVRVGHAAYTDRFHELSRLVPHLVTLENKMIERNGSIKNNPEKRGNGEEPSRDRNVKDEIRGLRFRIQL